jgi:hypothetical protein
LLERGVLAKVDSINGEVVWRATEDDLGKLDWERERRGVDGGDSRGTDGIGDDNSDEAPVQK